MVVHPDDERYQSLIGKKFLFLLLISPSLLLPTRNVDIEFGTGALKITLLMISMTTNWDKSTDLKSSISLMIMARSMKKAIIFNQARSFDARKNIIKKYSMKED